MKALLLDLDNTLIDRDAAVVTWLGALPGATLALAERLPELVDSDRGGYGDRSAFFARASAFCALSASELRRHFNRELPRLVRLRPDAESLLRRFAGPKVVVSNGGLALQRRKARAAGLAQHVDHLLVSGAAGPRKPDAAFFHRALALAECAPDAALMIGDHPHTDVAGALAAGIPAVLLRTRWFDVPAGMHSVGSLAEIPC